MVYNGSILDEKRHQLLIVILTLNPQIFLMLQAVAAPAAGGTRLGLEVKKEENLPDWYSQVSQI